MWSLSFHSVHLLVQQTRRYDTIMSYGDFHNRFRPSANAHHYSADGGGSPTHQRYASSPIRRTAGFPRQPQQPEYYTPVVVQVCYNIPLRVPLCSYPTSIFHWEFPLCSYPTSIFHWSIESSTVFISYFNLPLRVPLCSYPTCYLRCNIPLRVSL